mgnify:FL=1|jgi:hypothetical protein
MPSGVKKYLPHKIIMLKFADNLAVGYHGGTYNIS